MQAPTVSAAKPIALQCAIRCRIFMSDSRAEGTCTRRATRVDRDGRADAAAAAADGCSFRRGLTRTALESTPQLPMFNEQPTPQLQGQETTFEDQNSLRLLSH